MIIVLRRVWAWVKKYWKLLVGFLLALGGIGVGIAIATRDSAPPPIPPDLDEEAKKALDAVEAANHKRDERLEELEVQHHERLKDLTEEQQAEYDGLKDKPIEEVARWIDNL